MWQDSKRPLKISGLFFQGSKKKRGRKGSLERTQVTAPAPFKNRVTDLFERAVSKIKTFFDIFMN
jgi:hypothetical protein